MSIPAACELGYGRREALSGTEGLYAIGVDSEKTFFTYKNARWVIYQGHHGDIGAQKATIILPSTAYSEKNGTYISLYHTIQHTKAAIQHCGEARDDYKAIRALAEQMLGSNSSFSCFEETIYP